jgi:hypothetical protein
LKENILVFFVVDVSGLMAKRVLDCVLLALGLVVRDEERGRHFGPTLCFLLRYVRRRTCPGHSQVDSRCAGFFSSRLHLHLAFFCCLW